MLREIRFHRRMRLHSLQDLGTLALGLRRDCAFKQCAESSGEVLLECFCGFLWHALAESSTRAQDQVPDNAVLMIEVELHRDHPTDRVPDEYRLIDLRRVEHRSHVARMFLDRITALRLVRTAMSAMVHDDNLVGAGDCEDLVVPDVTVRGPRMEKHDRRALSVRIVENLGSFVVRVCHLGTPCFLPPPTLPDILEGDCLALGI